MNKQINDEVKKHCISEAPREACGLIACDLKSGIVKVFPCKNSARDKLNKFKISTEDFLKCRSNYGSIISTYHSHCNPELGSKIGFSTKDVEICNECMIPFLLYTHPEGEFSFLEPEGYQSQEIIGRPYIRGFWDCYTLCRDYYRNKGIYLNYYFPPKDDAINDYDHFESNFKKEGFREIPFKEAAEGDLFLFRVGKSKTINHASIFLGGVKILSHSFGSKASVKEVDGRLMKYLHIIVRYESLNNG